ncbi:MAG TPA: glycosyltransferase family 2 protein [Candidatus Polarisedimenticolaceae bacterium]|nr:glycosyltransferase family 2 protein [Candidatus Polarisedimenticolaceae bacterium]
MNKPVDLSFVIPVYNGGGSIGSVVRRIHELYRDLAIEVVLVNDGSRDDSEQVCAALVREHPRSVVFVHLARNFGEHNAVLAGLNRACGNYVVVLDDDGQNPPEEVRRLYAEIRRGNYDVVYGRYRVKHHSLFRNLGSWFNDRMANLMLHKPRELYLSSFKLLNRFVVGEIVKYRGAFPYVDGLILRTTRNLGQIDVEHRPGATPSNYDLRRLFLLWLNMFLNFSITPLRLSALLGVTISLLSVLLLVAIVLDKLYWDPDLPLGLPTLLVVTVFFGGVQLVILGMIGEYLGRLFLDHSQSPQYVVRYVRSGDDERG